MESTNGYLCTSELCFLKKLEIISSLLKMGKYLKFYDSFVSVVIQFSNEFNSSIMDGLPWVGSIHILKTVLDRAVGPAVTGGPRIMGGTWVDWFEEGLGRAVLEKALRDAFAVESFPPRIRRVVASTPRSRRRRIELTRDAFPLETQTSRATWV